MPSPSPSLLTYGPSIETPLNPGSRRRLRLAANRQVQSQTGEHERPQRPFGERRGEGENPELGGGVGATQLVGGSALVHRLVRVRHVFEGEQAVPDFDTRVPLEILGTERTEMVIMKV